MKLLEFASGCPDEASCVTELGELKEKMPHVRPECGHAHRYRKKDKACRECKGRHYGESLRKGTVMENSGLSFRCRFITVHLLTIAKNTFSATGPQRQPGRKCCRPIGRCFISSAMSRSGVTADTPLRATWRLTGGLFSTEVPDDKKGEKSGRGTGSWSRAKVFVMVVSEEVENPKSPRKFGKAGHVRMIVVSDLKSGTIPPGTGESVSAEASVVGDDTKSHVKFPEMSKEYAGRVVSVNEAGKEPSWCRVAIADARIGLADICHGIKQEFLKEYPNEFRYKFNRCCFGERLFDIMYKML